MKKTLTHSDHISSDLLYQLLLVFLNYSFILWPFTILRPHSWINRRGCHKVLPLNTFWFTAWVVKCFYCVSKWKGKQRCRSWRNWLSISQKWMKSNSNTTYFSNGNFQLVDICLNHKTGLTQYFFYPFFFPFLTCVFCLNVCLVRVNVAVNNRLSERKK